MCLSIIPMSVLLLSVAMITIKDVPTTPEAVLVVVVMTWCPRLLGGGQAFQNMKYSALDHCHVRNSI